MREFYPLPGRRKRGPHGDASLGTGTESGHLPQRPEAAAPQPQRRTKTLGAPFSKDEPPPRPRLRLPPPPPPRSPSPQPARSPLQPRSPSTSRRSPNPARTAPARPRGGLSWVLSSVNMGPAHTPLAGRRAAVWPAGNARHRPAPPRPARVPAPGSLRGEAPAAEPGRRARSGSSEVCRRRAGGDANVGVGQGGGACARRLGPGVRTPPSPGCARLEGPYLLPGSPAPGPRSKARPTTSPRSPPQFAPSRVSHRPLPRWALASQKSVRPPPAPTTL